MKQVRLIVIIFFVSNSIVESMLLDNLDVIDRHIQLLDQQISKSNEIWTVEIGKRNTTLAKQQQVAIKQSFFNFKNSF